MGEVGEVCEILQWKGEVKPGVPELSEEEKVHLGEELSDVLIYLIRLSGTELYIIVNHCRPLWNWFAKSCSSQTRIECKEVSCR